MSSVGQVVGGIVGGVVGFFVGGPTGALYGAQIGIAAGGLIDPPDGPVINGPRLDDLSVQTSTYGAFIPRNYGTVAQTGNVLWLKGDKLTETQVIEESGGKGGPTTTTKTWEYSATFALGLCEGPINGIRRIWINGQLWYDAGSGDISTVIASNENSGLFTLYLGTDTQLPDPLMQADKGVANVPAYRGLSYIVFDNLPLAKYNNSLAAAQVKVEIVKSGTGTQYSRLFRNEAAGYFWAHRERIVKAGDHIRTVIAATNFSKTYSADGTVLGVQLRSDTEILGIELDEGDTILGQFSGMNLVIYTTTAGIMNGTLRLEKGALVKTLNSDFLAGYPAFLYAPCADGRHVFIIKSNDTTINGWSIVPTDGLYGKGTWVIVDMISYSVVSSGDVNVTLPSRIFGNFATKDYSAVMMESDLKHIWRWYGAGATSQFPELYSIDDSGALILVDTGLSTQTTLQAAFSRPTVWADNGIMFAMSGVRLNLVADTGFFCVYTRNIMITQNQVALSTIVSAECLTSTLLLASDLDVTELTDSVRGYRVSSLGALRGGLDPIRAAWPFDVVQNGYKIKFKRRGSASVVTINADELDARAAGENPGVQITNSREMDTLLPSRLRLNYIDSVREYDTNEQISDRGL